MCKIEARSAGRQGGACEKIHKRLSCVRVESKTRWQTLAERRGGPLGKEDPPRAGRSGPSAAADVSKYLGVGLTWALSTILFLFVGRAADRWLGTEPILTLIGAFVGAGAGFYYMVHHLVVEPRRREAERKADRESRERDGTEQ